MAAELAAQTGISPEPGSAARGAASAMRAPTADLGAYNEYVQARSLMNRVTPDSLAEAREHLERAIQRDPAFALAYDALAEIYWNVGISDSVRPGKPSRQACCLRCAHWSSTPAWRKHTRCSVSTSRSSWGDRL
jgi:hypothetical protein